VTEPKLEHLSVRLGDSHHDLGCLTVTVQVAPQEDQHLHVLGATDFVRDAIFCQLLRSSVRSAYAVPFKTIPRYKAASSLQGIPASPQSVTTQLSTCSGAFVALLANSAEMGRSGRVPGHANWRFREPRSLCPIAWMTTRSKACGSSIARAVGPGLRSKSINGN
jgi:hypothetical protein